jgi:asparagine synthase (glutamine-hydrolysing)
MRAYTIVSNGLAVEEEEGRYAQQVAARMGVPVEYLILDEYLTRPPQGEVGWVLPEPGWMLNQSAEYEVARRVSTFARALLIGMGGDPLLSVAPTLPAGATQWHDAVRFGWRALAVDRRLPRLGVRSALRRRLRGGAPPAPRVPDWIRPEFADRVELTGRLQQVWAQEQGLPDRDRMLHPFWLAMFAASHPGAHGLPLRILYPFFDLRLVEYVWGTPPFPWRYDKHLLREAMRGRLPETVRRRPKTPLYVVGGSDGCDDPRYRLARRRTTKQQRRELISTPALAEYVDVERARSLIEKPAPIWSLPAFDACFPLAHWLEAERVACSGSTQTKDDPHVPDPAVA